MAKQLVALGFTDGQAEAVTTAVRRAQDTDQSSLATKADIIALKNDLSAELLALKNDLKTELHVVKGEIQASIAQAKNQIIRWVIGLSFAQAVVAAAMIKFMH